MHTFNFLQYTCKVLKKDPTKTVGGDAFTRFGTICEGQKGRQMHGKNYMSPKLDGGDLIIIQF